MDTRSSQPVVPSTRRPDVARDAIGDYLDALLRIASRTCGDGAHARVQLGGADRDPYRSAVLHHPGLLVVGDARRGGSGLDPSIGFCAGMVLHDARGRAVGTLLITADAPRQLEPAQIATLTDVATSIEAVIGIRERVAALNHIMDHDYLTGLLSRSRFDRLLHEAVEAAGVREGCVVLCLDVDGFKAINDTHGHAVGDAVLVEAARRLSASVGPADHVARLSGDELAILMTAPGSPQRTRSVAKRALEAFAVPVQVGHVAVSVRISIGAACAPADANDAAELLRCADRALYQAKRTGGHRCRRFEPDHDATWPTSFPSGRWPSPPAWGRPDPPVAEMTVPVVPEPGWPAPAGRADPIRPRPEAGRSGPSRPWIEIVPDATAPRRMARRGPRPRRRAG